MKKYTIYAASLIVIIFAIGTMNLSAQTQRPTEQKTGTLKVDDNTNSAAMNANALLEMQTSNKGLLLPRLPLKATNDPYPLSAHVAGMTVYNTAVSDNTILPRYYISPGMYYNDGTKWVRMSMGSTNWFYMPSISFNTTTNGTFTKDLYELYYEQFSITDLADGVAPAESRTGTLIKSTSAPASVPYIPGRADLYYYITAYDPGVFSGIAISDDGIMTYTVTAAATDCSYINIIFVLK